MKVGLMQMNSAPYDAPEAALAVARLAERHGVDSLWADDRVVLPAAHRTRYPYADDGRIPGDRTAARPDPLTWLGFVAAATASIRLVTGMLVLPQRNPVLLAKQAATLDRLSGGRLTLGVGLGWFREEFEAVGASFDDRAERFEEYVAVLRALWSPRETFTGRYHRFTDAACRPKPVRSGGVPLVMGGHSLSAARRAGRLADGFCPIADDPSALFTACREAAERAGRDPDDVTLIGSAFPPTEERVTALRALGVSEVLVAPPRVPADELPDAFADFAERVLRPVSAL